jgi:hypothetical protein
MKEIQKWEKYVKFECLHGRTVSSRNPLWKANGAHVFASKTFIFRILPNLVITRLNWADLGEKNYIHIMILHAYMRLKEIRIKHIKI